MKIAHIISCMLAFSLSLSAAGKWVQIKEWRPQELIPGRIQYSMIDKDGAVIATFFKIGNRMITPDKTEVVAPIGQGPDEVTNIFALCRHEEGRIAIAESMSKIKVFEKSANRYKLNQTVWLQRGKLMYAILNGLYVDKKWFTTGVEVLTQDKQKINLSYLTVFDEKGKKLKNLLRKEIPLEQLRNSNFYGMRRYVLHHKDKILCLVENELKVYPVSIATLAEQQARELEKPAFYKEMPPGFFKWSSPNITPAKRMADKEYWLTSYSRITKAVVEKDWLVLQVRTCSDKLKRFALLFYDADTFKLKHTVFTDDLLLGSKDGQFYFFAGGDPGLDDDVEQTLVRVYALGPQVNP